MALFKNEDPNHVSTPIRIVMDTIDAILGLITDATELVRQHPGLSLLHAVAGGFIVFVWNYTGHIWLSEHQKEKMKARSEKKSLQKVKEDAKRLADAHRGHKFSFGRVFTDVYVLDFSLQGYPDNFLKSTKIKASFDAPAKHVRIYADYLSMFQGRLQSREIFEGTPKIAPKKVKVDRSEGDEGKLLVIDFDISPGYVHQRAATEVYRSLSATDRANLCAEPSDTMEPFFSNSLGVIVAVITGDEKLVFVKRGRRTAVNAEKVICGAVESITIGDLHQNRIDPVQAAARALNEELGINLTSSELSAIKITSCVFNCAFHEWNLIGHADLRPFKDKYTSETLEDYKATGKAHDAWESSDLLFINFKPKEIAGFLLSLDAEIANYAKVAAIFALLCCYGTRDAVAAAFVNDDLAFDKS